jgi:hypothetical protein
MAVHGASGLRYARAITLLEDRMLSWLAKKALTHILTRLNDGGIRPALRMDGSDVRFRFPGESSWATDLQGKEALARWLQRLSTPDCRSSPT